MDGTFFPPEADVDSAHLDTEGSCYGLDLSTLAKLVKKITGRDGHFVLKRNGVKSVIVRKNIADGGGQIVISLS